MGVKGSVFSRRGKCLEVMQQVKLLVRREEMDGGVGFLQRQMQMEHRESEPLTDTRKLNLASGQQWCGGSGGRRECVTEPHGK